MLNEKKIEFDKIVVTAKPDTDISEVLAKKPLTEKEDKLLAKFIQKMDEHKLEPKDQLVQNIPAVILPQNGSWGLTQAADILRNDKTSIYNQTWVQNSEFVKKALVK